jgi:hypothetical protein
MAPKKGAAVAPPVEKKLSDMDVAAFLEEFRTRPLADQQRSAVWQELASFPQWAAPQFTDGVPASEVAKATKPIPRTATQAPPDPRLPAGERARIRKEQEGTPTQVHETTGGRAITTKTAAQGGPNVWADYKAPPAEGFAFMGVQTEVKPPFPGAWERTEGGWVRRT